MWIPCCFKVPETLEEVRETVVCLEAPDDPAPEVPVPVPDDPVPVPEVPDPDIIEPFILDHSTILMSECEKPIN